MEAVHLLINFQCMKWVWNGFVECKLEHKILMILFRYIRNVDSICCFLCSFNHCIEYECEGFSIKKVSPYNLQGFHNNNYNSIFFSFIHNV
jgi:hypothetical protein